MIELLDYTALLSQLDTAIANRDERASAQALRDGLPAQLTSGMSEARYGDIPRWRDALQQLPDLAVDFIELNESAVCVASASGISDSDQLALEQGLRGLHPWRKGPFKLFGTEIDTEWRSDFKWQRLEQYIEPLSGRWVLDVGCGSGYHCWRMLGADAELVLGIDPTPLFIMQYWALQKYIQSDRSWVLPMRMEDLPVGMRLFDTVFSMGILYHRRSPMDHLLELREALRPGGQLVLETLVIEGNEGDTLVPEGRYAKMGNVWFLPSVPTLCLWLKKMNFTNIQLVDVSVTTQDEQRSTEWMQFQSLADFLDPDDKSKTIEGYPAPRRAIVTANV